MQCSPQVGVISNTPSPPKLSTHPLNQPYQHTLSTSPINTTSQHTLSTHLLITPSQYPPSTNPINTPYRHTFSIQPLNPLNQLVHFHTLSPPPSPTHVPAITSLVGTRYRLTDQGSTFGYHAMAIKGSPLLYPITTETRACSTTLHDTSKVSTRKLNPHPPYLINPHPLNLP